MTPIINSRDDLEAMRGSDVYSDALRAILGATTMWVNDAAEGDAPEWRQVSVGETLARLDLTIGELLAECEAAGITPTNPAAPISELPEKPIPQQVPMWAVRTVLQNDNLFDQAQSLIDASTDNALKNVWEYGNFADRNSRAINVLAIELNLTDAQVDQMFIDANSLAV